MINVEMITSPSRLVSPTDGTPTFLSSKQVFIFANRYSIVPLELRASANYLVPFWILLNPLLSSQRLRSHTNKSNSGYRCLPLNLFHD